MKKAIPHLLIASFILIYSCGLISNLIPDVETTVTTKIPITITKNFGVSDPDTINLKDSEDYSEFEGNIDGFEINEIRFEIMDFDAPSDLYFSGKIFAESEDGLTIVEAATIEPVLLSSIADDEIQHDAKEVAAGLDKIIEWLDSPGKFIVTVSYTLTNGEGLPYPIPGETSYFFNLKIIFDVTVITGV